MPEGQHKHKLRTVHLPKVFSFAFLALLAVDIQAKQPTNVLLIMSDNQSAELIGSYGNAEIRTPNIDRLATQGIKFNNAFSVNGVCSPTRATLLTGLIPSQTGIHVALPREETVAGWSAIEEFRSLPQTLSEAGYNTGLIGKYHLGNHSKAQLGFKYWLTLTSGHTTSFHDVSVIENGKQYIVKEHLTDFWTNKAVTFLEEQKEQEKPFFLFLSYNGPYMLPPTVNMEPRNRHAAYYKKNTPTMPQEPVHPYLKNWAKGLRSPTADMVQEGTTAWKAIEALNNKTAMVNAASETQMVDDGVGTVMDTLKKLGLDKDTLVIYTSDQGASYGQHGLWGNTSWSFPFTAYDINMHTPLIFRHPGSIKKGLQQESIISQYDIFPTLLDYLNLDQLEIANTPGKSFTPMLQGKRVKNWQNTAFFEFVTVRVIRTPDWKYMKRLDDHEPNSLYDLNNDPQEQVNLIADPLYAGVITDHDTKLTDFFATYANEKYDLWKGGTGKGILLGRYYGRNDVFSSRFSDWKPPFVEKAKKAFTDL